MPPTTRKNSPKAVANDEPDLLSGLQDDSPAPVPNDAEEVLDLLDGLSEDNGTPWLPDDDDDPSPDGIQGRVVHVGEISSDYGPEAVPLIELEAADGTVWSIRGYSTVLRNQISKADPKVGDFMAARWFGAKMGKSGREYQNYKVAVKRA